MKKFTPEEKTGVILPTYWIGECPYEHCRRAIGGLTEQSCHDHYISHLEREHD